MLIPSVIMLKFTVKSIILNAVMLCVNMLNVLAPFCIQIRGGLLYTFNHFPLLLKQRTTILLLLTRMI